MSKQRLQLTWYNKSKALIPTENGKYGYSWVNPADPRYCETHFLILDEYIKGIQSPNPVLGINTFKRINILMNVLCTRQLSTGSIKFVDDSEYGKSYIDEVRAFRRLIGISDERALSNEEQVILFAEYAFLIKYANDDYSFNKEIELNRWLRLVSNLVQPMSSLSSIFVFHQIIEYLWTITFTTHAVSTAL